MGQASSTFILKPDGRSNLTFDTLDILQNDTGYYVHSNTIKFNEVDREAIFYSGGAGVEGGEFVSSYGPLVAIEFPAVVWGTTRVQMFQRARALKQAVTNLSGGVLEYRPDGVTTRSTFYHYVKSAIPALAKMQQNL